MFGRKLGGLRPLRMMRAIGRLLRDPNDTVQVFEMVGATGASAIRRKVRVLRQRPDGQALLRERPSLGAVLSDSKLEDFAPGTLGREYHQFLAREGITTEGLVAVSDAGHGGLTGDERYLADRMVHQHDLWHVITGYQGDLIGETCLLAFTTRHTLNPATGILVAIFYVVAGGRLGTRKLIVDAIRRAGLIEEMTTTRLEELLHTPLSEVRATLGLDEPTPYEPVRAKQLGRWGIFGPIAAAS